MLTVGEDSPRTAIIFYCPSLPSFQYDFVMVYSWLFLANEYSEPQILKPSCPARGEKEPPAPGKDGGQPGTRAQTTGPEPAKEAHTPAERGQKSTLQPRPGPRWEPRKGRRSWSALCDRKRCGPLRNMQEASGCEN